MGARQTYKLIIVVGTSNKLKVAGVKRVCRKLFKAAFLQGGYEVSGIDILSKVSRTPLTFAETKKAPSTGPWGLGGN